MTDTLANPLSREDAVTRLKALECVLKDRGVASLHLYGSTARNEANASSDVDVFLEMVPDARLGLGFFDLGDLIEAGIGRPVDLTTRNGIHEMMRSQIEAEAIRIF